MEIKTTVRVAVKIKNGRHAVIFRVSAVLVYSVIGAYGSGFKCFG